MKLVRKRTLAYLLPWIVWTILIRGLVFQQSWCLDIPSLFFNMDRGYWFLITIWTIAVLFGLSQLVVEKFFSGKSKCFRLIMMAVAFILEMLALLFIGLLMGLSFFCIKLTLYYMPFYFAGYLFGQIQPEIEAYKYGHRITDGIIALCFVVWIALLVRYNFYYIDDNALGIVTRAIASLCGCSAVCGLVSQLANRSVKIGGGRSICGCPLYGNLSKSLFVPEHVQTGITANVLHSEGASGDTNKLWINNGGCDSSTIVGGTEQSIEVCSLWKSWLTWIGRHSLKIYVLHGLLLNLLNPVTIPEFNSILGVGLVCANYSLTLLLCMLIIFTINTNAVINMVCFGKIKRER